MNRIAHISLQTRETPQAKGARLRALRLLLAQDAALGEVSPILADEGPGFTVGLPELLDEDEAAARIHGAAFTCGMHADELDVIFAVADPVPQTQEAILRLSLAGPLDLDERNDEYERLKAIGGALGWPFMGGHLSGEGVHADLLAPEPASPRGLGVIIVNLVAAATAQEADLDRLTVQVFAGGTPRRDALLSRLRILSDQANRTAPRYARLQVTPREGQADTEWPGVRDALLGALAGQGWQEVSRFTGDGEHVAVLRVPHADSLRAGREFSAGVAATPAAIGRVSARLMHDEEARAELGRFGGVFAEEAAAIGHADDLTVDRVNLGVQEALLRLLDDGEAWARHRHYGTRPEQTPAGPAEPSDGWESEAGDGVMLDERRFGFIRNAAGSASIIEWATGNLVLLSPTALAQLTRHLARGA